VGCVFVRGLLSHGEDESHQATKNYTFPIGLFNALVIFAREGELQRGLRGNSPLCRGNGGDCSVEVGCGPEARAPKYPHAVALGARAAGVQRRRRVEDRAPVPSTLRRGGCGPEARAPRYPPTHACHGIGR
jgi:hypothetical protein